MRTAIVLGSGRSGTSLLAGMLADAGYRLGERLLRADESNPTGYFEDARVNAVNEDLLAAAVPERPGDWRRRVPPWRLRPRVGERWLTAVPLDTPIPASQDAAARMAVLVRPRPLALKDPRFCLTLPAWRPHLPDDTVFVCVFREPARTVASMLRMVRGERRWWAAELWTSRRRLLDVWAQQYRHVLTCHRHDGMWVFVHYDQLLDASALPRLEAVLGVDLDSRRVDPALQRAPDEGGLPESVAAVYDQLCRLAAHHRLRGQSSR